jgi:hypothetical protein
MLKQFLRALYLILYSEGGPCWLLKLRWMGNQSIQMKEVLFLVGSLGLSCRNKRFLFCLGCSSRPSTKYFFLTLLYFNFIVPIAQQAGQAGLLGRLSLRMCLWLEPYSKIIIISAFNARNSPAYAQRLPGGLQGDVVFFSWPIAPLVYCMSPNAGGRGSCGVSNKMWKSNSIFNLWSLPWTKEP